MSVAVVAGNTFLEFFVRKVLDDLREEGSDSVHPALWLTLRPAKKPKIRARQFQIVPARKCPYPMPLHWVTGFGRNFIRQHSCPN